MRRANNAQWFGGLLVAAWLLSFAYFRKTMVMTPFHDRVGFIFGMALMSLLIGCLLASTIIALRMTSQGLTAAKAQSTKWSPTVKWICFAVFALILFVVLFPGWYDADQLLLASHMKWRMSVLQRGVEDYRHKHGSYPAKIDKSIDEFYPGASSDYGTPQDALLNPFTQKQEWPVTGLPMTDLRALDPTRYRLMPGSIEYVPVGSANTKPNNYLILGGWKDGSPLMSDAPNQRSRRLFSLSNVAP